VIAGKSAISRQLSALSKTTQVSRLMRGDSKIFKDQTDETKPCFFWFG
jgi:hypothetical protein